MGPIVVVSVVMTAAAYFWAMAVVVPGWNTPHTALEGISHAPSAAPRSAALARRVMVVVVDGLSFDHAGKLEELRELREQGAFRLLESQYPTFTAPNITAMMTGVGPRESGVRLNGPGSGVLGLDDVAHAAWDQGVWLRVRSRTYPPFDALSRAPLQADVKRGRLQPLLDWEIDRIQPPTLLSDRADTEGVATILELEYFGDVDEEGHRSGADSPGYDAAARRAARFVRLASEQLDKDRDLLFVLSDHGHLPEGGHGGDEAPVKRAFFLAWGHGVKPGADLVPRAMRDVASTLTLALGARTPSSNLGAPMIDLFDVDDRRAALLAREPFDQASHFGCTVERTQGCEAIEAMGEELEQGRGASEAIALLLQLGAERDASARAREDRAFTIHILPGLLCSAAFFALSRRRSFVQPRTYLAWVSPLFLAAVYALMLRVLGYRPTMSTMRQASIFFYDAVGAGFAASVVTMVAGRALRFRLADATWLAVAPFTVMLPLWAAVGANPSALGPPIASVLVFTLTPLVPVGGAAAIGVAIFAVRRERSGRDVRT